MKKILIIISSILMNPSVNADLNILTCEPEWLAMANEIGGDKIVVSSATTGLQDPHRIEARPSLIAKARRADLLICTGADLEVGWLPLLLRKSSNPKIQLSAAGYFMATDYVLLLEQAETLDRSEGDIHAPGNPHIQSDPYRLLDVAEALTETMGILDPDNASYYQNNFIIFSSKWRESIKKWESIGAVLKGSKIITYHRNWIYLQEWLGLELVATIEPKPGITPSSSYLVKLVKNAKQHNTKLIINSAYTNPKSSKWLAKRTGIPRVTLPSTIGGTEQATDLFSLFDETLKLLSEAHGN
ncbi:MAG: zinc ABC transporter solute-binding protein [Gammaproteobacteria bacterium]|nr:zinc ABC transporter solute-binding protein [Gammaproteobacteria bacterium]